MQIEAYIHVDGDTPLSHDLQPADGQIELQIGSPHARDSSIIRLIFDNPNALTNLADAALDARAVLMGQLSRQLPAARGEQLDDETPRSANVVVIHGRYEIHP